MANGIKISWDKVTGAARYRVFCKSGNSWKRIADMTATSGVWRDVRSGTRYTVTVRCVSADGKSYASGYDAAGVSIICWE